MRMKIITEDRTLREAANEFLAFKRARKLREKTKVSQFASISIVAY